MVRPLRPDLPILLAAEGPRNVALAREIADGWIATYYSPYRDAHYRAALAEGAARPGARAAAAAIPTAMIEQVALIGPASKIRDELVEWRRSLLTTLLVHVTPEPAVLRQVAELVLDG
jgi:alkanesulfonate monooxygenase SsuD/methylene tetrahydromethanopterin reductase-like flavin-dependent oxidoreductase (luciferase family)